MTSEPDQVELDQLLERVEHAAAAERGEPPAGAGQGLGAHLPHATRDDETGFEHHGFLNVLLATRTALDGDDVVATLEEQDRDVVASRVREVGSETLARTRRWFASFGCCGVQDPLEDLVTLGLLTL